jgi:hypothetical protein
MDGYLLGLSRAKLFRKYLYNVDNFSNLYGSLTAPSSKPALREKKEERPVKKRYDWRHSQLL